MRENDRVVKRPKVQRRKLLNKPACRLMAVASEEKIDFGNWLRRLHPVLAESL